MSKILKTKTKNNFDLKLIDQLILDPVLFILNNDAKTIVTIISYVSDKYYNGVSVISDDIYDFLIDTIKDIDPENKVLKQIGAKIVKKNKTKLPYFMGSMDKIKPSSISILDKWKYTFTGPYVYSDKLDGVSALLVLEKSKLKLYTRGDGKEGLDITKLVRYIPSLNGLNLKNLMKFGNVAIRGELVIGINKFKKYSDNMANARNMVSGIVNSKKIDNNIMMDVDFVAYEIINPWFQIQSEQWKLLKLLGFNVVYNSEIENDLIFSNLTNILIKRKTLSEYEIDGIIVSNEFLPSNRNINSNPDYAFAFKDQSLLASAIVEVLNVVWTVSKDGYIKPTLSLVPTHLSGVTISSVTAINAKYVLENKLGPGSIIELIRSGDVIPKIQKIIKSSTSGEAQFPDIEYEWTQTNVDIKMIIKTIEQEEKELTFFFKKLSIANVDESTVRKMIKVGINSIKKILTITKDDLKMIDGFKDRMVNKIYQNIITRIQNLTMLDLMIASNVFGHGLGCRKLTKISESYPNIIKLYQNNTYDEIIDMIKQLDGYDVKTAIYFTDGLTKFIKLYDSLEKNMRLQLLKSNILKQKTKEYNKFTDKIIIFSGFRNKDWQNIIESNGGKVGSSVSSKTSLLVTTIEEILDETNAKVIKAKNLNIPIISIDEFETTYLS